MAKKYQSVLGEQKIFQNSTFVQHEEVKKNILILPELESLIPPLGAEERAQLEANILVEGCREALLVWPTFESVIYQDSTSAKQVYVLVDGHNRYSICRKNGLDFSIHFVNYSTLEAVKMFMVDNQLGRRNLTPEQSSYLRGVKYLNLRQHKGKYDRAEHKDQNGLYESIEGEKDTYSDKDHFGPYANSTKKLTTAEWLAEEFKVGQTTIKRDAEFAQGLEKLSPELKISILGGKIKLSKGVIQQLGREQTENKIFDNVEALEALFKEKKSLAKDAEEGLIKSIIMLAGKLKNSEKRKETCDKLINLVLDLKKLEL